VALTSASHAVNIACYGGQPAYLRERNDPERLDPAERARAARASLRWLALAVPAVTFGGPHRECFCRGGLQ
jgi:hypothetical protein